MHILPPPAKVEDRPGTLLIAGDCTLSFHRAIPYRRTVERELSGRRSSVDEAKVRFLPGTQAPDGWDRWADAVEGYVLEITEEAASIFARTPEGHLYGAMTLRQLAAQSRGGIPCALIGDSPALSRRGVQLSFPQGHTAYREEYMKHLVPQLARLKINELYLYLESYFDFPSLPYMAGPGAMTPVQARKLDKLCRSYNIRLVPMLNTLAHCGELLATQKYNHLTEYPEGTDQRVARPFNLCSTSTETEALVDGMLEDLLACFSSEVIHIGGDEVSSIGECPRCKETGADPMTLYSNYYSRILRILAQEGRKGGIWGDMLLHYGKGSNDSDGQDPNRLLPENVVVYDWHYSGGSRETLDFFVEAGFPTIACSSTHLCYTSALLPAQATNQRLLFADAISVEADGGMTTAWCNFTGLHEEQYNYLHATGAVMLWSGPDGENMAKGLSLRDFEESYSYHRYGIASQSLTDFLHAVGDFDGPVLGILHPQHGVNLRKCLYHTNNVLDFWAQYCGLLGGEQLGRYKAGVSEARSMWEDVVAEADTAKYPYLSFLEAPLLMHEHLILRYDATEAAYRHYDRAAAVQYEDDLSFQEELRNAADCFLSHLDDFEPIEKYLRVGRKKLGLDNTSLHRLEDTKRGIRDLAALIRHFESSPRPLPAFQQLHNVFLEPFRTHWYGDREHDWAAGPSGLRRHSLRAPGVWGAVPRIDAEG